MNPNPNAAGTDRAAVPLHQENSNSMNNNNNTDGEGDKASSTIAGMISRFRNNAPSDPAGRRMLRKSGELRSFWWTRDSGTPVPPPSPFASREGREPVNRRAQTLDTDHDENLDDNDISYATESTGVKTNINAPAGDRQRRWAEHSTDEELRLGDWVDEFTAHTSPTSQSLNHRFFDTEVHSVVSPRTNHRHVDANMHRSAHIYEPQGLNDVQQQQQQHHQQQHHHQQHRQQQAGRSSGTVSPSFNRGPTPPSSSPSSTSSPVRFGGLQSPTFVASAPRASSSSTSSPMARRNTNTRRPQSAVLTSSMDATEFNSRRGRRVSDSFAQRQQQKQAHEYRHNEEALRTDDRLDFVLAADNNDAKAPALHINNNSNNDRELLSNTISNPSFTSQTKTRHRRESDGHDSVSAAVTKESFSTTAPHDTTTATSTKRRAQPTAPHSHSLDMRNINVNTFKPSPPGREGGDTGVGSGGAGRSSPNARHRLTFARSSSPCALTSPSSFRLTHPAPRTSPPQPTANETTAILNRSLSMPRIVGFDCNIVQEEEGSDAEYLTVREERSAKTIVEELRVAMQPYVDRETAAQRTNLEEEQALSNVAYTIDPPSSATTPQNARKNGIDAGQFPTSANLEIDPDSSSNLELEVDEQPEVENVSKVFGGLTEEETNQVGEASRVLRELTLRAQERMVFVRDEILKPQPTSRTTLKSTSPAVSPRTCAVLHSHAVSQRSSSRSRINRTASSPATYSTFATDRLASSTASVSRDSSALEVGESLAVAMQALNARLGHHSHIHPQQQQQQEEQQQQVHDAQEPDANQYEHLDGNDDDHSIQRQEQFQEKQVQLENQREYLRVAFDLRAVASTGLAPISDVAYFIQLVFPQETIGALSQDDLLGLAGASVAQGASRHVSWAEFTRLLEALDRLPLPPGTQQVTQLHVRPPPRQSVRRSRNPRTRLHARRHSHHSQRQQRLQHTSSHSSSSDDEEERYDDGDLFGRELFENSRYEEEMGGGGSYADVDTASGAGVPLGMESGEMEASDLRRLAAQVRLAKDVIQATLNNNININNMSNSNTSTNANELKARVQEATAAFYRRRAAEQAECHKHDDDDGQDASVNLSEPQDSPPCKPPIARTIRRRAVTTDTVRSSNDLSASPPPPPRGAVVPVISTNHFQHQSTAENNNIIPTPPREGSNGNRANHTRERREVRIGGNAVSSARQRAQELLLTSSHSANTSQAVPASHMPTTARPSVPATSHGSNEHQQRREGWKNSFQAHRNVVKRSESVLESYKLARQKREAVMMMPHAPTTESAYFIH